MPRKCFVPVESWAFASPELLLSGQHTDVGLFAEALVLFDEIALNVQSSQQLADILRTFKTCFGDIQPFLELVQSGAVRVHYFDFMSAPIEKNGVYSYWNIQDKTSESSPMLSFKQKILQQSPIEDVLPKARHRRKLYSTVTESAIVDESASYGVAIEAARSAINSHEDLERLLIDFVSSIPAKYRTLFPSRVTVKAEPLENGTVRHHFNINFDAIKYRLPNLNFGIHIPGNGVIQANRIIYASRLHKFDVYLPNPIGSSVMTKLASLENKDKRFKQTITDLQNSENFPDLRTAFNLGELSWKDVLDLRRGAERFRKWFSVDGGKPEVALKSYSEEFKGSTGLLKYREKAFAIASVVGTITGTAVEKAITGGTSPIGPIIGAALISNAAPLAKDLFKASEEENWSPRFFGTWLNQELRNRRSPS